MAIESVVAYWRSVQGNPEVLEKAQDGKADPNAVVNSAGAAGFSFTVRELRAAQAENAFWKQVQRDPGLQDKIRPTQSMGEQEGSRAVARIAGEAGYAFTAEDLLAVHAGQPSKELTVAELEQVSGGFGIRDIIRMGTWPVEQIIDKL